MRLASDPALAGVTGRYFSRFRETSPTRAAANDTDAARLWEVAAQATGLAGERATPVPGPATA